MTDKTVVAEHSEASPVSVYLPETRWIISTKLEYQLHTTTYTDYRFWDSLCMTLLIYKTV